MWPLDLVETGFKPVCTTHGTSGRAWHFHQSFQHSSNMATEQQRQWLKEFEYNRNGTLDVFAFLEFKTGKVFVECTFDHKREAFVSLVAKLSNVECPHLETAKEHL